MEPNLLKPSLQENASALYIYNINNFFYVAFFGGIIPTMVLMRENAIELKISKKTILLMLLTGIGVLVFEAVAVALQISEILTFDRRTLRWILRGITIIYFLIYYWIQKPTYQQCMMFGGKEIPLFKPAVKWVLVGMVIETFLIMVVGVIGEILL